MVDRVARGVTSLIVTAALVVAVARVTSVAAPAPSAAPCSAASVTARLTHVAPGGVVAYGCEGAWAYVWATLSVGPARIGVTELMRYGSSGWTAVSRARYCHPGALPSVVYRRACFSN